MASIYLIGSLRNPEIPKIGKKIAQETGIEVFQDWFSAGPIADDSWQEHQKTLGLTYPEALKGYAAKHVFDFDLHHLNRVDGGILVLPAGKSAHLELGWLLGKGKFGYVLFDKEPERWDLMYNFAAGVFYNLDELINELRNICK